MPPTPEELKDPANEKLLKDLHTLLLETQVMEGKLVCGNCGHEYAIKEGIANFLLPNHLGECIHHKTSGNGRAQMTHGSNLTV